MTSVLRGIADYFTTRLSLAPYLSGFFWRTLRSGWSDRREGKHVFRQVFMRQILFTGVEAWGVVITIGLFTGIMAIMGLLSVLAPKLVGNETVLADLLIILVLVELGPLMTALVVIMRSGTAIAIEIGYMQVQGELQAIDTMGISHVRFIILPRLIGVTSAVVCLFLYFDIVALLPGFAVAKLALNVQMGFDQYLRLLGDALDTGKVLIGAVKAAGFGVIIAFASMYHGYSVQRSMIEVPQAGSKAAISSLILCILFNLIIDMPFYMSYT